MASSDTISIKMIAEEAGVSTATVSKVINDYPEMSRKAREKVSLAIKRLGGNIEDRQARNSAKNKQYTFAAIAVENLLLESFSASPNRWLARIFRGLQQYMFEQGSHLLVTPPHNREDELISYVKANIGQHFSGIIFLTKPGEKILSYLDENRIPAVSMSGSLLDTPSLTVVNNSNHHGIRLVTDHLIELGHRNIGYIGWWTNHDAFIERMVGFYTAMHLAGIKPREEWIFEGVRSETLGIKATYLWEDQFLQVKDMVEALIESDNLPTAFVCATDDIARRIGHLLEAKGISVPGRVSLTGWGNDFPKDSPRLTTLECQPEKASEIAIDHLINMAEAKKEIQPVRIDVPCLLVRGDTSTKPE